jgi:hypothetical protein
MTAAITDAYKKVSLTALKSDVDGPNNYYMVLGNSIDWNALDSAPGSQDSDISSSVFVRHARDGFQSYKVVESVSLVIPRVDWTFGTIYEEYDDLILGNDTAFYVMNEDLEVYLVLQQGKEIDGTPKQSTILPTGLADPIVNPILKTSDGYVWRYLYQILPENANAFITTNFVPIKFSTDGVQLDIQNAAVNGQILNIQLDSASTGINYSTSFPVTFLGDGSGAAATAYADADSGRITHIHMDSSAGSIQYGSNYTRSLIDLSAGGGTGGVVRAVMSPPGGIGADATTDLNADSLMFNTKFRGNENGSIVIENDFRQISIVKNPLVYGTTDVLATTTANALKKLTVTGGQEFAFDELITGASSDAKAYVDFYESGVIYYHQTPDTGYGVFNVSEVISGDQAHSGTITAINNPDVNINTGEVIYIDNRSAITRSNTQTEDIKLVIKL